MSSKAGKPDRKGDLEQGGKKVSIVDRAATMIECLEKSRRELSLADLSKRMSLPKPTAFRIATGLVRAGILEQNTGNGTYSLGFQTLFYAENLLASIPIRSIARPVMETLRDEINETIVLSIRDGDFRYNIDSVESTHAIGQTQRIGVPIPLYAGAASRVMLAAFTQNDLRAYLARVDLRRFSESTITDRKKLEAAIVKIRNDGYCRTSGEFTPGSHAVACSIGAPASFKAAALHVSIPSARYSPLLERKALKSLQAGILAVEKVGCGLCESVLEKSAGLRTN